MIINKEIVMSEEKIEFLSVAEVSDLLKVHWQSTLSYIKSGQLRAFKIGKGYKIKKQDLLDFIEKRSTTK